MADIVRFGSKNTVAIAGTAPRHFDLGKITGRELL